MTVPLHGNGPSMVEHARCKLATRAHPCTADDVVAELSFGLWVSFISKTYDRSLWVPYLHKAFPFYRGPRRHLHAELRTMLLFRNRIMHYEPIHHRHLESDHRTLLRLVGYLSPGMAVQLKSYDRVPEALRQRPGRRPSGG